MPTGNHRNPAALGLHLGDQRRLYLSLPMPTALDPRSSYDLAIHSYGLLLDVQKEPASLTTPPSATSGPTVQAGRLRRNRKTPFPTHEISSANRVLPAPCCERWNEVIEVRMRVSLCKEA